LIGTVTVSWVGKRFLNLRNTTLASAYTTWSADLGYRMPAWEIRFDGSNRNGTRVPIAESEQGAPRTAA